MYNPNDAQDKLDWMYKGANSLVDREEYLLGRKIDKTLEQLNTEEKQKDAGITQPKNHVEHECIPPSIRDYKLQVGDQVDLQTKLQEDPLVAIKKREEETRRQFLQNPIQLKKLQSALTKQTKKKNKKLKKIKKLKEDDIDALIAKKLKRLRKNSQDPSDDDESEPDESDDLEKVLLKKFHKFKNKLTEDDLREILDGGKSNESSVAEHSDSDGSYKRKSKKFRQQSVPYNDSAMGYGAKDKKQRFIEERYNKSKEYCSYTPESRNEGRSIYNKSQSNKTVTFKKQLTEEDKEKKRREMMANATWRDTERVKNVKRYREEDSKDVTHDSYNPDFIHKELLKSANTSSVESRIKSNINSIQRSRHHMNTNFSKR